MPFWSPQLTKELIELQRVQRRATTMVRSRERLPYKKRLDRLGFFSLEKRLLKGHMERTSGIL